MRDPTKESATSTLPRFVRIERRYHLYPRSHDANGLTSYKCYQALRTNGTFSDIYTAHFPSPPLLLSTRNPSFKAAAEHSVRHSSLPDGCPLGGHTYPHERQLSVEECTAAASYYFRRALAGLALKIDAARYKAEAGLSRPGVVL